MSLERQRQRARAALLFEQLGPRLWPPLGLLGAGVLAALLDLPGQLPPALHAIALGGFALGLAWLVHRGFRGFAWPGAAAAERRLEQDGGLAHQPLATLADRPAGNDPVAAALWQAHQARAAAGLAGLRARGPRPTLVLRDPRALRAALGIALGAALVMAGPDAGTRLRRGITPAFATAPPTLAPRLEAWVTPPAYTGAAPIFLAPTGGAATVPVGSRLAIALAAAPGPEPELVTPAGPIVLRAIDGGAWTIDHPLDATTELAVRRGAELARWAIAVTPDAPPVVVFTEPPGRAARGLALRLPWRATDDWGLAAVWAELRLVARPAAAPLRLELPLPPPPAREARGAAQPDLSAHPWAGLEVSITLTARDGADQHSRAEPVSLELPARSFTHPVAQRLVALRRALSLDPEARAAARTELEAILRAPDRFEHDVTTYLALRAARARLVFDRRPDAIPEVQELLWEAALGLEEGRDTRTARAVQAAREALREALTEAERNPAPPESQAQAEQRAELERRAQALREAIRRHLEALAERLQRENAEAIPFDPQARMLDQRELDRRGRKLEEAAREGRTEDAERELAELEEMLRALEEGRAGRAETPERQRQRQRGQQQLGVAQDMVQREAEMLDRSHQRGEADAQRQQDERRRQRQSPWQQSPPPGAENQAQDQAGREQDARRQRALRRALGELMQQFGDLTGEVPEALGRADQAMREAQEALGAGRDPADAQARAMRALQEGGRQMAQSLQRQLGMSPDGEGEGEGETGDQAGGQQGGGDSPDSAREQGQGRDPLGRRARDQGGSADTGADTEVPEEAELLRTRRLQEELRRRGAERERPAEELDYIDRLLRRF